MDFYEVYERHYDRVRNFILGSVKNRWAADDLVQETFLRVLQNLSQVRDEAKLSAWIDEVPDAEITANAQNVAAALVSKYYGCNR